MINCFILSVSGELCPSCTAHTLWPWCNVTQISWADWSAQLCRHKEFSIVWEENTGFSHKAHIQQNETIDKHLRTFLSERIGLLQSLRKDLFIFSHNHKAGDRFNHPFTSVTNLNVNKTKMLRENAAAEYYYNCNLESLNSLTGTAFLPWWNGCFMRNRMMPTEQAAYIWCPWNKGFPSSWACWGSLRCACSLSIIFLSF